MYTYFQDVVTAICEKDQYELDEFTDVEIKAVTGIQEKYAPVIKELCDSYRSFTDALTKLRMMNSEVEQVQILMNEHEPVGFDHRAHLPRFSPSVSIEVGLNRGNVNYYMNNILKGV